MGSAFSKQKAKVLVIGLDNSGKTTIINKLKYPKNQMEVAPTVGFNQEKLEKHNLNFTFFDMSGQNQYRDMWEQYATQIDGVIFVIDSSDKIRFSIIANELEMLLQFDHIQNRKVPILFLANKQDVKDAENSEYFTKYLKLEQLKQQWYLLPVSALQNDEDKLDQGLHWLSKKIQQIRQSNQEQQQKQFQ